MNETYLGIDVGSTTVKIVVLDKARHMLAWRYLRSRGQPRQTLLDGITEISQKFDLSNIVGVGLSGSGGGPITELIGGYHVNELIAQTRAVGEFYPHARTVIELGGQDSKFLSVEWDSRSHKMILVDFAMNNLCAAGTGSFLDQQAERLGISIENDFATIALQSENPARIAGRCTVFAKSDMIHLQQKGTPLADILAGLGMALARNFKSVIGKGKSFTPPIIFQGGVAYNQGVVRAFERVLGLEPGDLIIPQHHQLMAALGTAFVTIDEEADGKVRPFHGFAPLENYLLTQRNGHRSMPILKRTGTRLESELGNLKASFEIPKLNGNGNGNNGKNKTVQPIPVYLGVDVGSISTKVVLIDDHAKVVARRYLHTAGKPLEAVLQGLTEISNEVGTRVKVMGVGTTGSGRYLTADFVGGDVVRSEITAQARAAIATDPTVDTIFEIGGQDSKYISLNHGAVVNFTMNSACAAGTGSFLEEQADKLRINIEEEFSPLAFSSQCPVELGDRCTVFMESDLVHHQQQGSKVQDLTAGLAYAIAENYLKRVVDSRQVGKNIFFQGGVAWNESVVAAFQELLGQKITVPPHHDVTGAIGAALLAMEELKGQQPMPHTKFRGFDLRDRHYDSKTFVCQACPNLCEINKVIISGETPIFYGARCDMYEKGTGSKIQSANRHIPDLFAERMSLLLGDYTPTERTKRLRVGLPRILTFYDMFPYWRTFFNTLDIDLVLSDTTNPTLASYAKEHAVVEACYPVKLGYGHAIDLLSKDVDIIFMPSVIDRENISSGQTENKYCPYVPATSHLVAAALGSSAKGVKIVKTAIRMLSEQTKKQDLTRLAKDLGVSARRVQQADLAGLEAQRGFYRALRQRGREVLANLTTDYPTAVIVGRTYNTNDTGVSQDLPYKLRKIGIMAMPMDFLPVDKIDISDQYKDMFWRSGQDILAAATIIRDDPRLQAIYVTSFCCGPDSFLINFFRRTMSEKPFLELELDDHTADAGMVTRCEAFFESLRMGKTNYELATTEQENLAVFVRQPSLVLEGVR